MRYRYLACDLLTDEEIAELDIKNVTYGSVLTGWGAFSGDVQLPERQQPAAWAAGPDAWKDHVRSLARAVNRGADINRTVVYVLRGGQIMGGYILWEDDYSSNSGKVMVKGTELFSYFDRQDLNWTAEFWQIDQLEIVRRLLATAQIDGPGNIGLVPSPQNSGVKRNRSYKAYERAPIAQRINELAAVNGGFEHRHQVDTIGGARTRRLVLGYPTVGQDHTTDVVFRYPGNVLSYSMRRAGSQMENRVTVEGAGEGPTKLVATVADPTAWTEGYPLLDGHEARGSVSIEETLRGHADTRLKDRARPVSYPVLTVKADEHPRLGSYGVGDLVRVAITDPLRYPDGWPESEFRVMAWEVTPPEGDKPEVVKITLGGAYVPRPGNPSDPSPPVNEPPPPPPPAPEPAEPAPPITPTTPPPPLPVPYPGNVMSWRHHSRGDNVKRVQQKVNADGYSPALVVDGWFGAKTDAGVRWWQRNKARPGTLGSTGVDGVVGRYTWTSMFGGTP